MHLFEQFSVVLREKLRIYNALLLGFLELGCELLFPFKRDLPAYSKYEGPLFSD